MAVNDGCLSQPSREVSGIRLSSVRIFFIMLGADWLEGGTRGIGLLSPTMRGVCTRLTGS